jgi:hypothetical protein
LVADASKAAEVRRLLDRYLTEVVETYNLCPWARSARTGGEISVAILWGARPSIDEWLAAATELLALPTTRVAMVLAPELALAPAELRAEREQVARRAPAAGVADFHPDAELDTATPARLVPFVRRSPDPLLQFVPLAILDAVRTQTGPTSLSEQAQLLGGLAYTGSQDIGDRIAVTNHERVLRDRETIARLLDDIAADRRRSYPRVGIAINTSR